MVLCALHAKKPTRDPNDQIKQHELLYLITNYTLVESWHFMLDVVGVCAGMSQVMQLKRRCMCREVPKGIERARGGLIFKRISITLLLCHAF